MKVAVQCESPLLQRSLELFLAGHLSSLKQCDVVLRDYRSEDTTKPSLLIASTPDADIVKPFSRSQLMLILEKRFKGGQSAAESARLVEALEAAEPVPAVHPQPGTVGGKDFTILERRIEQLTADYQKNILESIRAFYES